MNYIDQSIKFTEEAPELDCYLIDICQPGYLQDHKNNIGDFLLVTGLYPGITNEDIVEGLMASLDWEIISEMWSAEAILGKIKTMVIDYSLSSEANRVAQEVREDYYLEGQSICEEGYIIYHDDIEESIEYPYIYAYLQFS